MGLQRALICFAILAGLYSLLQPVSAADAASEMQRGREARARNDFATAETAFAEAARQNPADAEAWHLLGLMRGFLGQYDTALAALQTAQKLAPKDLDIALSTARVTAFAGRYADAERRVDAILAEQPRAASAWVLKGRIAGYQSQFEAAKTAYDKAASLAPPDVDLLVAYGDLARAQNNEAEARRYYAQAAVLDPASAEVKSRLADQTSENANPWTLSLTGGKSWLSRTPAPDWTAFEAILDRDLGDGVHVFGGANFARRFSVNDVMLRAGGRAGSGRANISLDLGFTPDDDVLPEFQAFSTLSYRFSDGGKSFGPTIAVLDAQVRHYGIGTVKTLSPGFDQYLAEGRVALSARLTNTWDTTDRHISGWSAGALWQATDRIGLRIGYGNAPEAERGTVADTKTISGGLIIGLTDTVTWRIDLARESRQGGYRRVEALGGLAIKF